MKKKPISLTCFIAACNTPKTDSYLVENDISNGLINFAIPAFGVLFKCRASGDLLDLEFGAFFALLRFVKEKFRKDTINKLLVLSSSPPFVFSIGNPGSYIKTGSAREKLLKEHLKSFDLSVGFIEPNRNQALALTSDFSSTPVGVEPPFKPGNKDQERIEFKPIQKGIQI